MLLLAGSDSRFLISRVSGWLPLAAAAAAAKSLQLCPTLCDPIDQSYTIQLGEPLDRCS